MEGDRVRRQRVELKCIDEVLNKLRIATSVDAVAKESLYGDAMILHIIRIRCELLPKVG